MGAYRVPALMPVDVDRLFDLAYKATRGKRFVLPRTGCKNVGIETPYGPRWVLVTDNEDDAAYEAALDPETIMRLCEELKELRKGQVL